MKNYKFNINGTNYTVDINSVEDQTIQLELNGTPYTVKVDKEIKQAPKTPKLVRTAAVPSTDSSPTPKTKAGVNSIKSPLPGTILDIYVKVGDAVKIGQKLLMLEAMKMENNIDSDLDGVISEIKVRQGDAVMEGDVLIMIGE